METRSQYMFRINGDLGSQILWHSISIDNLTIIDCTNISLWVIRANEWRLRVGYHFLCPWSTSFPSYVRCALGCWVHSLVSSSQLLRCPTFLHITSAYFHHFLKALYFESIIAKRIGSWIFNSYWLVLRFLFLHTDMRLTRGIFIETKLLPLTFYDD